IASQLASGLLSSSAMADRNQRMLMLGLPLIFVTFIIRFPAGLMVYWITTNCWTIVQQLIVRKTVGVPGRPPVPAGAAALSGGRGGDAGTAAGKAPAKGGGDGKAPAGKTPRAAEGAGTNGASASGPPPSRRKKKRTGRRR